MNILILSGVHQLVTGQMMQYDALAKLLHTLRFEFLNAVLHKLRLHIKAYDRWSAGYIPCNAESLDYQETLNR
jgi:hypothetical protein